MGEGLVWFGQEQTQSLTTKVDGQAHMVGKVGCI